MRGAPPKMGRVTSMPGNGGKSERARQSEETHTSGEAAGPPFEGNDKILRGTGYLVSAVSILEDTGSPPMATCSAGG